MIRFIHTADIHLGTENYGRLDSKTGMHTRLLDFAKALDHCITTAIEQKVDFFLFCGDAYKTAHPSPTQQKVLLKSLFRLYDAQIPVVIVLGNHDNPMSFGKANSLDVFKELPLKGFHVIAQPQTIMLETQNGPLQIVGIPWPTRNTIALNMRHTTQSAQQITEYIARSMSTIIAHKAEELDKSVPAILAAHLTVSTGLFSGSEKRAIYGTDPILMPSQLAIEPIDYVALGHLHAHQNLNKNGTIPIVYPGSIERIDFGERKEKKGFCLVTVHGKGNVEYEFMESPMRTFVQIEVTIKTTPDPTEQIIEAVKKHDIRNAIVKIIYYPLPDIKDRVNIRAIQMACTEAMHIVSIVPIRKHTNREYRAALKVDMDFSTLLSSYFDTKPSWKSKKKQLIEQAIELFEMTKEAEDQEQS